MKNKKTTGRPTKLNPAILDTITNALAKCAPIETAAALAGINKDTLYAWLKKGARALDKANGDLTAVPTADRPFALFSDALKKAMAEGEVSALGTIWAAGRPSGDEAGQWQALAWILERTRWEKYGRRERLQHEGTVDGPPLTVRVLRFSVGGFPPPSYVAGGSKP